MTMTKTEVRIYVACLAAYNNGILHGRWIDAAQDADDLYAEINEMLKASPIPHAEEWAIHDYEGFSPWSVHEYESIRHIALAAELIEEHGEAAAAWLSNDGSVLADTDYHDLNEAFTESYQGCFSNEEEFAYGYVEDCGLPGVGFLYQHRDRWQAEDEKWSDTLSDLSSILDWEAIAEQLLDGAWTHKDANYDLHVFRSW